MKIEVDPPSEDKCILVMEYPKDVIFQRWGTDLVAILSRIDPRYAATGRVLHVLKSEQAKRPDLVRLPDDWRNKLGIALEPVDQFKQVQNLLSLIESWRTGD